MDLQSIVAVVIAIVVVYFFIKLIVSPAIRIILGIIFFLILIYVLQQFFGLDLNKILSPFGISLNPSSWGGLNLNWISAPINYYVDQFKSLLSLVWSSIPKTTHP